MKSLAKVVEILKKEFSMISYTHAYLSDHLGFDCRPCTKSFMNLVRMKGYTYISTDD